MKLFITMFFLTLSFKAVSAPLKVHVYLSDASCVDSGPGLGSEIWDEEMGMWSKTPTQIFGVPEAISGKHLGVSTSVVFPSGDADSLFFGWFQEDYNYHKALVNLSSNYDAREFKNLITENFFDYVLVHMSACDMTMVGRLSTGEVSQASYFLKEN